MFVPPTVDDLSSQEKVFAHAEPISLDKLKEIQKKIPGTTINDILAAVLNMCVHRYLQDKNDPVLRTPHSPRVRSCLPVSTRDPTIPLKSILGNYVGVSAFTLKFDYTSKVQLVRDIKHQLDGVKFSPRLAIEAVLLKNVLHVLPLNDLLEAWKTFSFLYSAMISNLRGPPGPLFLNGQQVEDMFFLSQGEYNAYFAAVSYNGTLRISLATVKALVPDPSVLMRLWTEEMEGLYKEVAEVDHTTNTSNQSSWVSMFGIVSVFSILLIFIAVLAKYYL
jgi:hypothetical protein